jgi:O-antigen/teichoic acid export membrane protein
MSNLRIIAENITWLGLSNFVTKPIFLFFMIFVARKLGVEDFGKFSFVLAFIMIFSVLIDFGFNQLTTRDVAKDKFLAPKYIANGLSFRIIVSVLVYIFIYTLINAMNYPIDTKRSIYVASAYLIFLSLIGFIYSIFRAFEKIKYESILIIIEKALIIFLGSLVLIVGFGLETLWFTFLFSSAIAFVISIIILLKKVTKFSLELDPYFIKKFVKKALPFAVMNIFIIIYFRIDMVMISMMRGDLQVGWYSAAYKFVEVSILIPNIIMIPIYPVFSKLYVSSLSSLTSIYKQVLKIMIIISLPIPIVVMIISEKIILVLYGASFINATPALMILIWAIPSIYLTFVLGALLPAINKQAINTITTGICMILNVLLNLILIPSYGYLGAGVSTVVTEWVLCAILFGYISMKFTKLNLLMLVKLTLVNISTILLAFTLFKFNANYVVNIILYLSTYITLIFLLTIVSKEESEMLLRVLRNGRQLAHSVK